MDFINKKILLLGKETYSYPLYFLAKKWRHNNQVAAFFFMSAETRYSECLLNTTTYYRYKRLQGIKVYDVRGIADEFTRNLNAPKIESKYIKEIEKNYTYFKNLNLQLMSSQLTTRQYHFRNYATPFTHEQQVYWLQLNYKRVFEILDDFMPDMILDCDDAELPRTIINEVAYKRKIPYITMEYPRYEDYRLFTYQMGIGVDDYFINEYKKQYNREESELQKELQYVDKFRGKKQIMSEEYKNTITSKYEKDSLYVILKRLYGYMIYFRNQDKAGDNKRIKKENTLLYSDSKKFMKYFFKEDFLRRKLYGKNKYFENPVEGEKYVYMPLHLIPESSTFVKAPIYVNELNIIEAISKSLPVNWKLYVKEHQAMLGERGVEFYKAVKRLPNVRLVQINYYRDPKPWIINAEGVVTITGTGAYEAALLGKRALVFGDVPFGVIEGVQRVKSYEDLPDLLKNIDRKIDNKKSCAAYIAAVKEVGVSIKFAYLMKEGEEIAYGRSQVSDKYLKELEKLEMFYQKAYFYQMHEDEKI